MEINYKEIHDKCGWHEEDILKSKKCGCFYCLEIFPSDEIKDWYDENPDCSKGPGKTAVCPKCGIDSVLPDNMALPLDIELLKEMKRYYFTP